VVGVSDTVIRTAASTTMSDTIVPRIATAVRSNA
jgi:hypothetical protein